MPHGTMSVSRSSTRLDGHALCGSITITYSFPDGTKGPEHPNPGQSYSGTSRTAYLPDNKEGNEVLQKVAPQFKWKDAKFTLIEYRVQVVAGTNFLQRIEVVDESPLILIYYIDAIINRSLDGKEETLVAWRSADLDSPLVPWTSKAIGSWSGIKKPDGQSQRVLDQVAPELKTEFGSKANFQLLEYRDQLVNGVNYYERIKITWDHLHISPFSVIDALIYWGPASKPQATLVGWTRVSPDSPFNPPTK